MKGSFRQSMAWLHTWTGLLLGWVLFFIFLTGTVGYFDTEIDRWMRPEMPFAQRVPDVQHATSAISRLKTQAPQADLWLIIFPGDRDEFALRILWQSNPGAGFQEEYLDATTGQPLTLRQTGGGQLLYRMHYQLHYLPVDLSYWLVGIASMFMLVAILTGIIVHRRIFVDFFTFRQRKGQRSWLDAHNVLAVMALPFHLMITYSGLIFFAYIYMAPVITATYGLDNNSRQAYFDELNGRAEPIARSGVSTPLMPIAPLATEANARWGDRRIRSIDIRYPGDMRARVSIHQTPAGLLRDGERLVFNGVSGALVEGVPAVSQAPTLVHDALLGLHEGLFAGSVLRLLYFLSGLIGTAMIGAGLVLWTVKRRERLKRANGPSIGLLLVERLNIGTIVGLPIAIAAYFWANRLIPVEFDGRAAWEAHTMFIVWVAMLLHPIFRSPHRAWAEQLWIATAAYGLLPVLNWLTTDRHLGVTVPHGDWVLAGFDLTMFAFGVGFSCVALIVSRKAPGIATDKREPLSLIAINKAGPAE